MSMSIKAQALAFRVWQVAEPIGWDCTTQDVARAVGVYHLQVCKVVKAKGWQSRFRSTTRQHGGYATGQEQDEHPATIQI